MTPGYQRFRADMWLERSFELSIGSIRLQTENLAALGMTAFLREGAKAEVVRATISGRDMAMKVFKKRYANPENVLITQQLKPFAGVPGLKVCEREVISGEESLLPQLTGLAYAVVMPWIDGTPWAAYIEQATPVDRATSIALARAAATVLAGLEQRSLVHADISSTNVFVTRLQPEPAVELIDVEDMYHPRFADILYKPDGSPGYAHPRNTMTCWNPYGDRFAASILFAEMLSWHSAAVRASRADASLFAPGELCRPGLKFTLVRDAVGEASAAAARLFEQAWSSSGLSGCPAVAEWKQSIDAAAAAAGPLLAPRLTAQPITSSWLMEHMKDASFQTSFASTVPCPECSEPIKAGNPQDHAFWCSHHPTRFKPLLSRDLPSFARRRDPSLLSPAAREFEEILARYSNPAPLAPSEPEREPPPPPPPPRRIFDDVTFRPLAGEWAPPRRCPQCGNKVTEVDGKETGHELTCPNGPLGTWFTRSG